MFGGVGFGIYLILLSLWMAFFSQFVLPIHTLNERINIFDRLNIYLMGGHGPAIFVRDGHPDKGENEEKKKGPGVFWLDSASGLVVRTDTELRPAFGPGVHFTIAKERIAGYIDLHNHSDGLGPKESGDPFAKQTEKQTDDEYLEIQGRRMETRGLTRDGIEVVPKVSVGFKIDADPIRGINQPGSHFGYSQNAVWRAVRGEQINPNERKDTHRYHVPWNQVPALVAVDIWRDLIGKFTVNDLFEAKFTMPPSIPDDPPPLPKSDPLLNPLEPQGWLADILTGMFREANRMLSRWSSWVERTCKPKRVVPEEMASVQPTKSEKSKNKKVTGLQLINFMVKERLQRQKTAVLNQYGNYIQDSSMPSEECQLLQEWGIRALSASVSNPKLPAEVNEKLVSQWTANWLSRAKKEQEQLNKAQGYGALGNEETALRDYILRLSRDLLAQVKRGRASELRETLRAILLESRTILIKESGQYEKSPERELLEEIVQWLETRD